jgi:molybdenum cofactor synthesis domain-containing protein
MAISLGEAQAYVLARVGPLPGVAVPISEAVGLVVAEPVVAGEAVPPFANSAMDGFAVRAADTTAAPVDLAVVGTLAAGQDPSGLWVGVGQAVRIMTGAAMPAGADAVVMVEGTTVAGDGAGVCIEAPVTVGTSVRGPGEDVRPGDLVAPAGKVVTPAMVAVLASVGVEQVVVHRRPRVAVLSTGDELVQGSGPLRPGQIRDSNRHALVPLVAETGAEVVDLGIVVDDRDALTAALDHAAATCDALLTSGGVSMGDFDEVKAVLAGGATDMRWMQIAIRPAKPFAFGLWRGVPVFGLPGNPVSSVVSFELLARPALRAMAGRAAATLHRPRLRAVASEALARRSDGKLHVLRVLAEVDGEGRIVVRPAGGGQGSHQLTGLANANALALVPDGPGVAAGASVDVLITGELVPAAP